MSVSEKLAREVRSMTFEALPPAVVHAAKRQLIDNLGCALGGFSGPSSQAIQRVIKGLGGTAEATIVGSGLRTSCLNASLANGVMVRYSEAMDEGFSKSGESFVRSGGNPGAVIPGLLAVGERQHSTGKELLTAIVLGYGLLSRFDDVLRDTGWKFETTAHYVVPLVAGKLLGLNEEQMVHAVGISGSFGGVLKTLDNPHDHRSMARDLGFHVPAYQGILSALMAQEGFTGPSTVFESPYGFAKVIAGKKMELNRLTEPRKDFPILYTGTKLFACFGRMIGSVDATLRLVKEHDIGPEQVAEVRVTTQPRAFETATVDRYPQTKQAADHSFHYVIAMAIIDRAVTPEQFTHEKLQDPRVRELSSKIEYKADPELAGFHSAGIVEIITQTGARYSVRVETPKGKPENPMSDTEIEEKFRSMAARLMDEQQIGKCIDAIYNVDELDDIARLMRVLVCHR